MVTMNDDDDDDAMMIQESEKRREEKRNKICILVQRRCRKERQDPDSLAEGRGGAGGVRGAGCGVWGGCGAAAGVMHQFVSLNVPIRLGSSKHRPARRRCPRSPLRVLVRCSHPIVMLTRALLMTLRTPFGQHCQHRPTVPNGTAAHCREDYRRSTCSRRARVQVPARGRGRCFKRAMR